jgi:hypothetical protein
LISSLSPRRRDGTAHREKEMNQINMQASAMKMLFPQKTAAAAN